MALLFTFGITVGSVTWPYASYMMPSGAVMVAQAINLKLSGIVIMFFSVDINLTNSPVFMIWLFAGVTLIFSILNWIFMLNIKGLSVIKVQEKLAIE